MPIEEPVDYYEVLQVNTSADPETIDRVYRLLAQRFHPDNQQTGDERRFRTLLEAYTVLRDPEKRARGGVTRPRVTSWGATMGSGDRRVDRQFATRPGGRRRACDYAARPGRSGRGELG